MTRGNAERLLEYIDTRIAEMIERDKPKPFGWNSSTSRSDYLKDALIDLLSEEK